MKLENLKPGDVLVKEANGKLYKIGSDEVLVKKREIINICKWKHYRIGQSGAINYSRIKEILGELGFTEAETKECLHP